MSTRTPTGDGTALASEPALSGELLLLHQAVHDRIRLLWRERLWWRTNRWAEWPDIRKEHDTELRALIRLASRARRQAEAADAAGAVWRLRPTGTLTVPFDGDCTVACWVPESADPITAGKGWTESELRLAAGDR